MLVFLSVCGCFGGLLMLFCSDLKPPRPAQMGVGLKVAAVLVALMQSQ